MCWVITPLSDWASNSFFSFTGNIFPPEWTEISQKASEKVSERACEKLEAFSETGCLNIRLCARRRLRWRRVSVWPTWRSLFFLHQSCRFLSFFNSGKFLFHYPPWSPRLFLQLPFSHTEQITVGQRRQIIHATATTATAVSLRAPTVELGEI